MEELLMLRQYIQEQNYEKALELVGELEEMSKEDKLNKIYSYAVILLLHLIKQEAEQRSTRSWEFSIYNATKEIKRVNKRRKSGGYYAAELIEGVVYVASPLRYSRHGQPHSEIMTWLGVYRAATPGIGLADNTTVRLDIKIL